MSTLCIRNNSGKLFALAEQHLYSWRVVLRPDTGSSYQGAHSGGYTRMRSLSLPLALQTSLLWFTPDLRASLLGCPETREPTAHHVSRTHRLTAASECVNLPLPPPNPPRFIMNSFCMWFWGLAGVRCPVLWCSQHAELPACSSSPVIPLVLLPGAEWILSYREIIQLLLCGNRPSSATALRFITAQF